MASKYHVRGTVDVQCINGNVIEPFEFETYSLRWPSFAGVIQQALNKNPWHIIGEGFSVCLSLDSVEDTDAKD